MTFFYDLNKKLAGISDKPENKQLNERDEGKPGKMFSKIAKDAGERYGSKAAGERVAGAVRAKLAKQGKLEEVEEGFVDSVKSAAQKALDVLGHGSDEDMIRDLQRKAGVPQTGKLPMATPNNPAKPATATTSNPTLAGGQKPMAEADMEEGNRFTGNLMKARAAGKKQADLDGDGDMEQVREASKPDYIDLDKDGNRKESMKKAAADKKKGKQEVEEGWDDMLKDVEKRRSATKKGEITHGHKHDIEDTGTGRRVTRRVDPNTGYSVGADDDKPADGEKRGRGRPKKTDKAPERVTAKAYKHKGGRKMSKEEIEEAIASLEGHGYKVDKLDEKAVSKAQQRFMGMAHAMQKGEKIAGAGKELKKVAKTMKKGDVEDFAKTKHKGLPEKKKKEVDETTVSGSVATSSEAPKSKGKGGMTFGKGIYDSLNRELEGMIAESMNVSISMNVDEHGEPRKNITVSAEGEAAEQLAQLLNLAGMSEKGINMGDDQGCGCETSPCSCSDQMVDENAPDWPTQPETTGEDDPRLMRWAGGLNKPKETGQTTAPVVNRDPRRGSIGPAESPEDVRESKDLGMKLYAELKSFKG